MAHLAVTMLGGFDERAAMRRATNRSHAQVRSKPGDAVSYNAFEPELQQWPPTRAGSQRYWRAQLADLEIDERTRDYLIRIVRLEYLDRRIPPGVIRVRARLVAGYLGPDFRAIMRVPWTDVDERRFARFNRRLAAFMRIAPRRLREAPLRRRLDDVGRRLADGRPVF